MSPVQLEREGALARIVLDRPPLNVLNLETLDAMHRALETCAGDPSLRVVVLAAKGDRVFSAGVDVADHVPERVGPMLESFHRSIRLLGSWSRVSIASVHAPALGGGCELALACDLVFAAAEADFATPEIELGCFPPVALASFPRRVGRARAADWILTGRRFSAAEAHAAGLVTRVVRREELDTTVSRATEALLAKSPSVLRLVARALREAESLPFPEALQRAEEIYRDELLPLADCQEGIAAFLAKRKPTWKGA